MWRFSLYDGGSDLKGQPPIVLSVWLLGFPAGVAKQTGVLHTHLLIFEGAVDSVKWPRILDGRINT